MSTDLPAARTASVTSTSDVAPSFAELYEREVAQGPDLYVSVVRDAVEGGVWDPEESLLMACAAAETADATTRALSSPWSLYTPRQAATVASALFVQLRQNAASLQELGRAIERIGERGDVELPDPAGPGQPPNLATALETLGALAEQLEGLVARHAGATVDAIRAAAPSTSHPADAHETLVAVAALLTEQAEGRVTLMRAHADGEYVPDSDGEPDCGCQVTIHEKVEEYTLHRGEHEWNVIRQSDVIPTPDGGAYADTWSTLSNVMATAHPQQLTDDILSIIEADRR
ncbi:hypothetical protein ACN20G_27015 (plasmid) [Streptomyces sp. BI20]|uniref:hypothetical protein n=1 Tax=Streptomyces sp. BI20 TaxID=3403460 RepID=UPI003C734485